MIKNGARQKSCNQQKGSRRGSTGERKRGTENGLEKLQLPGGQAFFHTSGGAVPWLRSGTRGKKSEDRLEGNEHS